MPQQDYLDLIKKYESGGQNVVNYNYGTLTPEGKKQTAQGYYQITDTNWNNIAPLVGIDLGSFPNAMKASEEDQRKVANYLLTQTPEGISHWADFNPKLKSALSDARLRTAGKVPDYQDSFQGQTSMPQASDEKDLSKMSTEELLSIVGGQDSDMAKRLRSQFDALKPSTTTPEKKTPIAPKVSAPSPSNQGFLRRYAESTPAPWEDPLTLGGGSTMRAAIRAFLPGQGIGERISDVGRASSGLAETAAQLYPFGSAITGTASELPSLLQSGKSLVAGLGTGIGAQKTAEAMGAPPEVAESAGILAGVGGGAIGPKFSFPTFSEDTMLGRLARHPGVQNALIRKIPIIGGPIADIRAANATARAAQAAQAAPATTPAAPKVTPPPEGPSTQIFPTRPPTPAQLIDQLRSGAIDENRFLEHAATRTGSLRQATEELTHAQKVIAEGKAKEVERLSRTAGPAITPVPNVGGTTSPQATQGVVNPPPSAAAPTSTNPIQPVQATLPPGLTITAPKTNLPPVAIPPGGPQTSTNPLPVAPLPQPQGIPSPGLNLGSVGSPRPPLAGPAPTGTAAIAPTPTLTPSPEVPAAIKVQPATDDAAMIKEHGRSVFNTAKYIANNPNLDIRMLRETQNDALWKDIHKQAGTIKTGSPSYRQRVLDLASALRSGMNNPKISENPEGGVTATEKVVKKKVSSKAPPTAKVESLEEQLRKSIALKKQGGS